MRDRFLFRADREGYAYGDLFEARVGSVRLLHPSERARRTNRGVGILIAVGFIFAGGYVIWFALQAFALSGVPGWVGAAVWAVAFFGGLLALEVWWDRQSLPLLAENPALAIDLNVLGVESFGTFQELRASSASGELRITVEGRPERVREALRFAGSVPQA